MQPCRSSRSSSGTVAHKRATVLRGILVNDVQPACGSMPGERILWFIGRSFGAFGTWGVAVCTVTRHDHNTRAQWAAEGLCRRSYFTTAAGSLSVRVAASHDNTQAHGSRTQSHAASPPPLSRPSNDCDYACVLLRDGQACETNL